MNASEEVPVCSTIEDLIPHRSPMRLARSVVRVDDESIEVEAVVQDSWPTARDGQVRTLVLIELVAQTAAALQGWRERQNNQPATGGLLVGIHEAKPRATTIPVGTHLRCFARITHGAPNYLAFEGQVTDTDKFLWLTGSIQAYRPDAATPTGDSP